MPEPRSARAIRPDDNKAYGDDQLRCSAIPRHRGGGETGAEEEKSHAPARQVGRESRDRRTGTGDYEHAKDRLQLVADPVEADPQDGVGTEKGGRGQRRASDRVNGIGENDESRSR